MGILNAGVLFHALAVRSLGSRGLVDFFDLEFELLALLGGALSGLGALAPNFEQQFLADLLRLFLLCGDTELFEVAQAILEQSVVSNSEVCGNRQGLRGGLEDDVEHLDGLDAIR